MGAFEKLVHHSDILTSLVTFVNLGDFLFYLFVVNLIFTISFKQIGSALGHALISITVLFPVFKIYFTDPHDPENSKNYETLEQRWITIAPLVMLLSAFSILVYNLSENDNKIYKFIFIGIICVSVSIQISFSIFLQPLMLFLQVIFFVLVIQIVSLMKIEKNQSLIVYIFVAGYIFALGWVLKFVEEVQSHPLNAFCILTAILIHLLCQIYEPVIRKEISQFIQHAPCKTLSSFLIADDKTLPNIRTKGLLEEKDNLQRIKVV